MNPAPIAREPSAGASLSSMLLGIITALAALHIWLSAQALPDIVASHFGSSGLPNGYMPRRFYIGVMMAVVVVLPLLMTAGMGPMLRMPGARINLPNRDYWLAPERRASTIAALLTYMRIFAAALVLFLSHVHDLVVEANLAATPMLDSTRMIHALVAFTLFVLLLALLLWRRFRV